jgi:hypothetical protein
LLLPTETAAPRLSVLPSSSMYPSTLLMMTLYLFTWPVGRIAVWTLTLPASSFCKSCTVAVKRRRHIQISVPIKTN